MATMVPWRPPWDLRERAPSNGELARRGFRARLYCYGCFPPWEIGAIDFNRWPWRRYLNYPSDAPFICPACRRPMKMRVWEPDGPQPNLGHLFVATPAMAPGDDPK
jgi:hypothetical protein